jgi:hypothetical protein
MLSHLKEPTPRCASPTAGTLPDPSEVAASRGHDPMDADGDNIGSIAAKGRIDVDDSRERC